MGVPMPHVTSFCCCLGLEVGTRLIGYLHLVTALCMLVLCSVYASKFSELAATAEDAGDGLYSAWHVAATCVSVLSAGHVLLAATLLYGVYKRKTMIVRVWVVVMSVLVVAGLVLNVASSVAWGFNDTGSDVNISLLEGIIFFGFVVYCIVSVNSYYMMVRSCERDDDCRTTNY